MKTFDHDEDVGLLCPWCPSKPPISECHHNPFMLMREIDKLSDELDKSKWARNILNDLKDYINYA